MFRSINSGLVVTLAFLLSFSAVGQPAKQIVQSDLGYGWPTILDESTNGLEPAIIFDKDRTDWDIQMDYYLQTNFPRNTWVSPTNRFSAKLELWSTNGLAIPLTSADALAALHPPAQTTVSNIINNVHPSNTRGMNWLRITKARQFQGVLPFSLQSAFGISFTNDYVFQITPFIYRADTNLDKATLVEFPPIKIKLMADGHIQKLE
jgi:hypothetical protein